MTPSRNDIPVGRPGISRADLAAKWGVSDRTMREIINTLRSTPTDDPCAILSSSHGDGYWRSKDTAELDQYLGEADSRIRHLSITKRDAHRVRYNIGQVRMEL